jgi:hypothetical protein
MLNVFRVGTVLRYLIMRGEPECFALLEQQTEVLDEPRGCLGQVLEYSPATSHKQTLRKEATLFSLDSNVGDPDPDVLGLLDLDPLVRGTDLNTSIIKQNVKKTFDSY